MKTGTEKLKTALLFGSFNPLHEGHLAILRYVLENCRNCRAGIVVSPENPFKKGIGANAADRLEAVRRTVKETGLDIDVLDVEFSLPWPLYTINTLRYLRDSNPGREYVLVVGADCLAQIPQWHEGLQLLREFEVWAYPRQGNDVEATAAQLNALEGTRGVTILRGELHNISSTEIRKLRNTRVTRVLRNFVKDFIVAGHRFSIVMDDASPLWERIRVNYGPFEADVPAEDADKRIFTLYVSLSPDWALADTAGMEPLFVGNNRPEETQTDFYRDGDGFYLDFAVNGKSPKAASLRISGDFKSGTLSFSDLNMGRFAIDNAAMLMFAFSTASLMTLEMHSSVTVNSGKAYMFLAESGTGKSTHSRMWLENIPGSELLNDDNPVVRVAEDGSVTVYGSPWSGKTPCYRNASAPLGAMVQIRRSPMNAATPLSIPEAYALVSSSSSGFRGIDSMADGLHETIAAIALAQPCFVLDCRPDAEAALVCHKAVCR